MDCSKVSLDYHLMKHRYENDFLTLYNPFFKKEISDLGGIKKKFDEVAILVKVLSDRLNEWKVDFWRQNNPKHLFDDRALPRYTREIMDIGIKIGTGERNDASIDLNCSSNGDLILSFLSGCIYYVNTENINAHNIKDFKRSLDDDEKIISVQRLCDEKFFCVTNKSVYIYNISDGVSKFIIPSVHDNNLFVVSSLLYSKDKVITQLISGSKVSFSLDQIKDDDFSDLSKRSWHDDKQMAFKTHSVLPYGKDKFIQFFNHNCGYFEILSPDGKGKFLSEPLKLDSTLGGNLLHVQVISTNRIILLQRIFEKIGMLYKANTYISIIDQDFGDGKYKINDVLIPRDLIRPEKIHCLPDGRIIVFSENNFCIGKIQENKFILEGEVSKYFFGKIIGFQILPDGKLAIGCDDGTVSFFDNG